jgi:hypothetical protein
MARRKRLVARLERTFMDVTGARSGHGAQTWIARAMRVDPRSVRRMVAGDVPPDRLEGALDLIETGRQAALRDSEAHHVEA